MIGFTVVLLQAIVKQNVGWGLHALLFLLVAKSTEWLKALCKPFMSEVKWLKRPDGTRDCGLTNNGGLAGNQCGFPSGHMSMTAFLFTPFWWRGQVSTDLFLAALVAVGWSRWSKNCHNLPQIVAGALYGFSVGTISNRFIRV